jgi:nucleoid-associated protein YgaU
MMRVMAIVTSVGLFVAGGMAGASQTEQVRLPISKAESEPEPDPELGSVVVAKGDHLWKISARSLGDHATESEIAPYWRDVIRLNTPNLRSGDPDLIYPGEVVALP